MTVEIVILGMIAIFLGLRLYSVLGRRSEQEDEVLPTSMNRRPHADSVKPVPATPRSYPEHTNAAPQARGEVPVGSAQAERGLQEIMAADRSFDPLAFLEGSKGAYRMILEAFWSGNREELQHLCDRDVYEGFVAAIEARETAGEKLDNRLIRIEEAVVISAAMQAPLARITVRFRSDIAGVTRSSDGTVIAGSLNDAVEADDVWTFTRNVSSSDPSWQLDETDAG